MKSVATPQTCRAQAVFIRLQEHISSWSGNQDLDLVHVDQYSFSKLDFSGITSSGDSDMMAKSCAHRLSHGHAVRNAWERAKITVKGSGKYLGEFPLTNRIFTPIVTNTHSHINTHIHTHLYIYIYWWCHWLWYLVKMSQYKAKLPSCF